MRFLIDECLSLDLVSVATEAGYEAYHVVQVGKAGWKDWNVARYAGEGDLLVVTNNGDDFCKLYATRLLHAGLIILVPNDGREVQKRLFSGTGLPGSRGRANQPRSGSRSERRRYHLHALRSSRPR
jgi:predicted nuclease of predicted toxin-antitoxin system